MHSQSSYLESPIFWWAASSAGMCYFPSVIFFKSFLKIHLNLTFILIGNARRKQEDLNDDSIVVFNSGLPVSSSTSSPLKMRRILDLAPITVTDHTPMETVIDMFRKLGLRHVLVTHNGCAYF